MLRVLMCLITCGLLSYSATGKPAAVDAAAFSTSTAVYHGHVYVYYK